LAERRDKQNPGKELFIGSIVRGRESVKTGWERMRKNEANLGETDLVGTLTEALTADVDT